MAWAIFSTAATLTPITSSTTLGSTKKFVPVDASDNEITITLPAASSNVKREYTIKKLDDSGNKVIIDANSAETIDGELTIELKTQYAYITIFCNGTEWFIVGGEYVKMEDTLDSIKTTLEDLLEQQEKALVLQGKSLKHFEDFTEAEPENEEVEEELRDMIVEVRD